MSTWCSCLERWKLRPNNVRWHLSKSTYAKKDRNGPPSANQGLTRAKPRHSYAVYTVTEILVRRKNWSEGPKFQGKWSAWTIFP